MERNEIAYWLRIIYYDVERASFLNVKLVCYAQKIIELLRVATAVHRVNVETTFQQ